MANPERLLAEAKCAVCLDCLNDAVTIQCGHNFCLACIQQYWQDRLNSYPCPICRQRCQGRLWTPNPLIRNLVENAKFQSVARAKKKRETPLCNEHNEVLNLFCEEDLKVLCSQCTNDHQGHQVKSLQEVASHHRKRLLSYVPHLRKKLAFYENLQTTEEENVAQLSMQIGTARQSLTHEHEHLRQFLLQQKGERLSKLSEAERKIKNKIEEDKAAFAEYISTCQSLYKDVAEKSVMDDVKLLTDIKRMYDMCENTTSPSPLPFLLRREEFYLPPQFQPLEKVRKVFTKDVTLDPQRAHPNLRVSEDKKSVIFLMTEETLFPFTDPVILGSEAFQSGRHYWEVRVDDKPEWMVGVCTDSLPSNDNPLLMEQNGYWRFQLYKGVYIAQGSDLITLKLKEKPQGVGIYLDYELGEISFYNLTTNSHIHSFFDGFSGILKPYFYVGRDPKPLTICAVPDV